MLLVGFLFIFASFGDYALLNGKRLTITTIDVEPYVTKEGNTDKGMLVDLMKYIWENELDEGTKKKYDGYKFRFSTEYGANKNGDWTGMIGELKNDRADIAIAPLTITDERKEVVDFSDAWLTFHLTVLVKKEYNIWTLKSLVDQTRVKYGCVKDGSTMGSLKDADTDPYRKMWMAIDSDATKNLVSSNEKGLRKVESEDYAFIIESPLAQYYISKDYPDCRLATFGRFMQSEGYAFAFPKNSDIKEAFSGALNRALHNNKVNQLYQKYIIQDGRCRHSMATYIHVTWPLLLGAVLFAQITK